MVGDGPVLHSRVPFAANNLSPMRIKQTLILHIPEHSPLSLRLHQSPNHYHNPVLSTSFNLVHPSPGTLLILLLPHQYM